MGCQLLGTTLRLANGKGNKNEEKQIVHHSIDTHAHICLVFIRRRDKYISRLGHGSQYKLFTAKHNPRIGWRE
jgi:hypothetical protein